MTRLPHDHPTERAFERLYVAITSACNRACPWCSVGSSPEKTSRMEPEELAAHFPAEGPFELQLEGGEPTVHPRFFEFVDVARAEPRMRRLVVCTNGVSIPRESEPLARWLERLGAPALIKLSINHHLLERDAGLLELAKRLRERAGLELVLNVRRRRGAPGDDAWVMDAVRAAGLESVTNDFFLQRYGLARDEAGWERPFSVRGGYVMVNPDGARFEADLEARADAMERLP
jgi:hypothetical protein